MRTLADGGDLSPLQLTFAEFPKTDAEWRDWHAFRRAYDQWTFTMARVHHSFKTGAQALNVHVMSAVEPRPVQHPESDGDELVDSEEEGEPSAGERQQEEAELAAVMERVCSGMLKGFHMMRDRGAVQAATAPAGRPNKNICVGVAGARLALVADGETRARYQEDHIALAADLCFKLRAALERGTLPGKAS